MFDGCNIYKKRKGKMRSSTWWAFEYWGNKLNGQKDGSTELTTIHFLKEDGPKKEEERCMTIAMVNMISNILHFPSLPRRIAMFEKSIVLCDGLYSPDWWRERPCRPLFGPQTLTLQGDGKEELPSHWGCAGATSLSMNGVCLGCSSVVLVSLILYCWHSNNPLG